MVTFQIFPWLKIEVDACIDSKCHRALQFPEVFDEKLVSIGDDKFNH